MELERWLRKNNMETQEMADKVGCTRKTLWKIKKGDKVDPTIARKVYFITGGQVSPQIKARGRPKKEVIDKSTLG